MAGSQRRLFVEFAGDYPHRSAGCSTAAFISAVLDIDVAWSRPDSVTTRIGGGLFFSTDSKFDAVRDR